MRHVAWVVIGLLGVVLWTALAARIRLGHVLPDAAVVTVVFLALRREPIPLAITALVLGHLVGRQALAPMGLHEFALTTTGIAVYMVSGRLAAGGAAFCAAATAVATVGYHLLLFLLLSGIRGDAGFSSWATALLIPAALATGALSLVSHPWMAWVEKKLAPEVREGLSWH